MCTLIVLHRCRPEAGLVVAANRDEFLDREAEGPALRSTPGGPVVAPRDLQAGGTWLGLNVHGVFAAVTNRRGSVEPDASLRSRGLLVMDALAAASADEAASRAEMLEPSAYNAFNLLVADGRTAHVVTYDEKPRRRELSAGAHVIGNADPNAPATPKIERQLGRAERAARAPADALLEALARVCRAHEGGQPLADTCVHAGAFGTRSSTLLRLTGTADGNALLYAEGAPCTADYRDHTSLLHELGAARRG